VTTTPQKHGVNEPPSSEPQLDVVVHETTSPPHKANLEIGGEPVSGEEEYVVKTKKVSTVHVDGDVDGQGIETEPQQPLLDNKDSVPHDSRDNTTPEELPPSARSANNPG
jgi:hypothetical protein